VLAVVLAAHWPALSSQAITFDDGQYLVDNRLVQDPSWRSVRRFFTEVLRPSSVQGYYQPLTMTSLMVDHALGGRPADLTQFHRTNLALHLLTTSLSIVFLWQLFRNAWVAAALGLLFGVHPLTIEPVAWVGERKTLLAAGFSLLCLVLYVAWTRRRGRALGGLVLLTYGLALLAKPTSTLLPGVLLLLDAWPLRRLGWRAVGEKVPLVLLGAAAASVTYLSQRNTAGVLTPGEYPPEWFPLALAHNLVFYWSQLAWPARLSAHYPVPAPMSLAHPLVRAGVGGTGLLAARSSSRRASRRRAGPAG
jgi:hypothetical protein